MEVVGLPICPTKPGRTALLDGSCRLCFPTSVKMDCMCSSVTRSCTEEPNLLWFLRGSLPIKDKTMVVV